MREKQENRDNYFAHGRYDHFGRWASYFYQAKNVMKTNPENILEVGVGNGVTTNYLKSQGYKVTVADIAEDLKPDVVADIVALPFSNREFDTVMACEILEHIPFEDSMKALKELYRVSKNYVVVSLPDHRKVLFSVSVKLPFCRERYLSVRLPILGDSPRTKLIFGRLAGRTILSLK